MLFITLSLSPGETTWLLFLFFASLRPGHRHASDVPNHWAGLGGDDSLPKPALRSLERKSFKASSDFQSSFPAFHLLATETRLQSCTFLTLSSEALIKMRHRSFQIGLWHGVGQGLGNYGMHFSQPGLNLLSPVQVAFRKAFLRSLSTPLQKEIRRNHTGNLWEDWDARPIQEPGEIRRAVNAHGRPDVLGVLEDHEVKIRSAAGGLAGNINVACIVNRHVFPDILEVRWPVIGGDPELVAIGVILHRRDIVGGA